MTTRARSRKIRFARPRQISRTKRTCILHTLPCARISARSGESEAQGRQSPEWDSGCGPCYLKGNKALLWLDTVVPSVPQVPLWHDFTDRMCFCKRMLVCPGELLQAGRTIYRLRRRQGQIFVAGAVCGGRPQNGLGRAGWAGLGWAGRAGWAYKGAGCSVPKSSVPFGRGPRAVGPQPNITSLAVSFATSAGATPAIGARTRSWSPPPPGRLAQHDRDDERTRRRPP